jgi:ABC-2 type transport system permease protein
MFRPLIALVRKDLQLFYGDRRALMMSFAAPIAIASFFGFVFAGQADERQERGRITVHAIDRDGSPISKAIVSGLTSDKNLAVLGGTEEEARAAVQRGSSAVAIVIPPEFGLSASRAFFRPEPTPELILLYDPSRTAELGLVRGLLTEKAMTAVSTEAFGGPMGRQASDEALRSLDESSGLPEGDRRALKDLLESLKQFSARTSSSPALAARPVTVPYQLKEEPVTARRGMAFNPYAQAFAGMGVQFVLFLAIETGVALLLERQFGLWKRLRSAPLSRTTLLAGKAISTMIIALVTLAVLFAFGAVVFGIRITGSLPGFIAVAAAFALMAATFGLLIAAIGRTPGATRGVAIFATLIMLMLGGAWMPMFLFPAWLQRATLFVPTRWAVDGLQTMSWRGLGLASALPTVAVLLGFAALFGTLAVARFRWAE